MSEESSMDKREWKPGDVAMVVNEHGVWNVAICALSAVRGTIWRYGVADAWMPMSANVRPLVVIDPENREQVERFTRALYPTGGAGPAYLFVQAALREFANPTPPKPDEPLGLGAVVEDGEGRPWVRAASEDPAWRTSDSTWSSWDEIADVHVLSEGVTR